MSGSSDQAPLRRNPFSPMAVAKITGFHESDADDLTVETDAIRQATYHLSGYLHADPAAPGQARDGEVIAILGDYGTGKTHLAIQLLRYAHQVLGDSARTMYLEATADGFVELHNRFMRKLGLAGVRSKVSDYYADIVAESLQSSGLDDDVVEWLRDRELVPQDVVAKLGLMESALLRKVQQTLHRVTENSDFGTALTLLLRSGFDKYVWSWLTGEQPHQVLQERGITKPIDSDVAALEAMGVFALLYGGQRAQFVLVIDELDKIFSGANQPEQDTVTAFQKLLEVSARAGACLVLSGLPEFRRVLRTSAMQRVSRTVDMAGLSTEEIAAFIRLAQQARLGTDQLAPFTPESVRFLRDITDGKARSVIRLCHDVYGIVADSIQKTGDAGVAVTDAMVREAARRQFGSLSGDDIDSVVRRVLDANGWHYLHDHTLGPSPDSKVDFWVTFQDRSGGCAVLLAESMLDGTDVTAVTRRSFAVREAAPDSKVILVVNGVLIEVLAGRLAESLDAEPLVYTERNFAENFRALLGATSDQLTRITESNSLAVIQQRIEQVNRQQSSLYGLVEQLAEHIDGVRSSSDRRLTTIQRELNALTHPARSVGHSAAMRTAPASSTVPAEVDKLFLDAVDMLEELTQLDTMMDEAFDHLDPNTSQAVQRRLREEKYFEGVGVALLLRAAVLAFRSAVIDWYARKSTGSPGALPDSADERLDMLCRVYDDITDFLPIFKLEETLIRTPPWTARSGGAVTELNQSSRRNKLRAVLDNLSPRVQRALLRSLQAGGN